MPKAEMDELLEKMSLAQQMVSPLDVGPCDVPTGDVKVIDGKIVVHLGRNATVRERNYLKGKEFNTDGVLWHRVDDGSVAEVKAALNLDVNGLEEKVAYVDKMAEVLDRADKCGSANDVFADFAKDAAVGKVIEMKTAKESVERQRAQETVLGYGLGKPIERVHSLNVNISNMNENELDSKIYEQLAKFGGGVSAGEGESVAFLVEEAGDSGDGPAEELPAASTTT